MCGFAGVIDGSGAPLAQRTTEVVLQKLSHRGPDAQHCWREGPATLLHARLRILDLSPSADQPMVYHGGRRLVAAYNGEIYNYRELRSELQQRGHTFKTSSDTEVLLAGFLEWGHEVFRRARGMWAAALWDPARLHLTLCRDALGKKPLVYVAANQRMAFASTIGALLPLLDHTPEVNPEAIDCYLGHLVVPFEHAALQGVVKLPPGSFVDWTPGGQPVTTRYWSPASAPDLNLPIDEAVAEVETRLRTAVRRRLESDVPLGVFLSAGYDSGLVAALAAEESGKQLLAVTAGTAGADDDERDAAELVARQYGLRHHRLEVPPLSAAHLPALIAEAGEPFGDPSIIPSFEVARAARRDITVALTGDGGDEGFFGYATFRGVYLGENYRRMVPGAVRRLLRSATRSVTNAGWLRQAGALFEYGSAPLADAFRNRMGFSPAQRRELGGSLQPVNGHRAEHIYADRLAPLAALPDADALRRVFFETYLPNDYLVKVDTATMAASLEARSPFLDLDLVEYVLRLPAEVAFPDGRQKALLRPLAERMLPPALLNRRKTGFGVPVGQWMRSQLGPAMEEFIFRPGTLMENLIDTRAARRFYREHCSGADHSTRLWSLLALGVWCAVLVERRWPASHPLPVGVAAGV